VSRFDDKEGHESHSADYSQVRKTKSQRDRVQSKSRLCLRELFEKALGTRQARQLDSFARQKRESISKVKRWKSSRWQGRRHLPGLHCNRKRYLTRNIISSAWAEPSAEINPSADRYRSANRSSFRRLPICKRWTLQHLHSISPTYTKRSHLVQFDLSQAPEERRMI